MTELGLLHLTLDVAQASSLKDKRRVIKGFKDRTRHAFNVSIAEVGALESYRRAELAVAMVANDRRFAESVLRKIISAAERHRDMVLVSEDIEWL